MNKARAIIVGVLMAAAVTGAGPANRLGAATATSPLTLNQHPRLGMSPSDMPAIVSRLRSGGEWNADFIEYVRYLESPAVWSSGSTAWADLGQWSMGAAFIYSLRTQGGCCTGVSFSRTAAEYAAQALTWSQRLISLDTAPPAHLVEHQYHSTFFVYDWIHPTMSPSARAGFVTYWKSLDGFAPLLGAASGNIQWANEQLSRGTARKVLAGLACAGDGTDEAWCTSSYRTYDLYIRHPSDGMVSRETQRGGTDASWIQGINYGLSYDAHHLAIAEMGWRTANGLSKAEHYTPQQAGYWLGLGRLATYFQRPWAAPGSGPDGRRWRYLKDVYTNKDFGPSEGSEDLVWWGLMRRELQGVDDDAAGLAAWNIAHRAYGGGQDPRYWIHTKFLGRNNAETGPDAIGLPLNKAFQFGAWMWRTGWTNLNDSLVTVFGYEFSGFRSAVGSFSIDYMGPAIVLPGSGGHDIDSAWHGFANTLGAPENRSTPETRDPENNDDYGFHRAYNPITPDFVQDTVADWLDRTERFVAPSGENDFGYLSLDRTRSMNGAVVNDTTQVGNTPKIASAFREFAVFPPANPGVDALRVVVSDRMTTLDPKFEKRWVLFYSGVPTVNGSASAGPSRGASGTTGKTTYTGATLISAVTGEATGNNRTWVQPIFPQSPRVVLVNFRRNNQVEDSYGTMHGTSGFDADHAPYVSSYRTEIIPSVSQLSDHFVNVIQVTTKNATAAPTEAIPGVNFKGARVGNRIAVFPASELLPPNGSFVIPTAGTYRVMISGIGPGATRTITPGGAIASVTDVQPTGTQFKANPQGVLYLQVVVVASGTGGANTLTLGAPVGLATPPAPPTGLRILR